MRLAESPRRPNNILAKRALVTAMTISLFFPPISFAQAVKNEATPSDQSSIPELRAPAALKLTDDPNYVAPPEPSDLGHPAEPNAGAANTTAQSINLAELRGKVIDGLTNQPLRDARAVLSKVGEEHKRYQTDSTIDGTFLFSNIEPGDYNLTLSADSKLAQSQEVKLTAGPNALVSFKLEDLEGADVLRVTGKRTLLHPENIGSETRLDQTFINHYKSGNDLRELIESTPGVIPDSYGNIIVRGEHNSINYVLDDVVLPEAAGVLQQSQFVTPRSLQSMNVDIGGYQAQDGGGPLGAVVHMKSLPILAKPFFEFGQQMGGPLAGNFYYSGSTAFSQNPDSKLYRLRIESSGSIRGTTMGNAPPVKDYTHNNRADLNLLTKLEYLLGERDTLSAVLGINHTFMEVPLARTSYAAGVRQNQYDAQDYLILNWKHKFDHFFDEANLHILNCFYWENFHSQQNVFDPTPVINGGQLIQSLQPQAMRFDYIFSAQGDLTKVVHKTHHFKVGFLDEYRPVHTDFSGTYYNNDPTSTLAPVGAVISPFTSAPGGPQWTKQLGQFHASRFLQSAYLQDSWRPNQGVLKRLTLDAGVRADCVTSWMGNTLPVLAVIDSIPGATPANPQPFQAQKLTDAQVSGRYGGSFVVDKNTVIRGSYSDLFVPQPVDIFSTPPTVTGPGGGVVNGYFGGLVENTYNGTVRPLRATRGHLIDQSIEHQFGKRFVARNNLFYKVLENYGDSGVISNTTIYNRQVVAKQEGYGCETRLDLKPDKNGYGFSGWCSSTVTVAYLRGSKQVIGGIYAIQTPEPIEAKYPDHDRRIAFNTGLSYKTRFNWWTMLDFQLLSGLQNELPVPPYDPHASRTPVLATFNLSTGIKIPDRLKRTYDFLPDNVDLRIQNLTNNREPTNLGSPFQGTRFLLPVRFLIGCNWTLGHKPASQVSTKPSPQAI
jgi:Carboxypeptidase regulatory-like domain